MKRSLFACLLIAPMLSLATAKDPLRSDVIGEDDRQKVDSTKEPWRAVGRITNAGYRIRYSCTGTLVAPQLVLTAGACLFDEYTHKLLPVKDFHFVAGMMRSDKFLGHAKAVCTHQFPDFKPVEFLSEEEIAIDAAVIVLDKPIKVTPLSIAEDNALQPGTLVSHAGYSRNHPYVLSVHRDCRVRSASGMTILTDCDSYPGQLGGPILVREGETWKLAAIMVAHEDNQANGGPTSAAWRSLLAKTSCEK